MSARKFTNAQCLALLDDFEANGHNAETLAHENGCLWTTIADALYRARVLRYPGPIAQEQVRPPIDRSCEQCGAACQNSLACNRRRRAASQLRGEWPEWR